jgi:hypothetical protein
LCLSHFLIFTKVISLHSSFYITCCSFNFFKKNWREKSKTYASFSLLKEMMTWFLSHSKMIRPYILLAVVLIGVFSTTQTCLPLPPPKENFSNQKRHVLSHISTQNRHALEETITYTSDDGESEFQTFPCVYEEVEYEHGAKFKTDYNTCFCRLGLLACTRDGVHWKLYL